jgi:phosphatidylinositol-3-phosphatase
MRKAVLICFISLCLVATGFSQSTPPLGHVVVVAFENHSYSQVVGSSAMPYLNGLISQYALATGYYANSHPSIGNYFELTTGQIITTNDNYNSTVSVDNLERQLLKAGKTWKEYAQSLPSTGYTGWDHYPYVKHHSPFAYFSDNVGSLQANNIVQFTQFGTDVTNGTLPNFSFVVPDLHHDGHDCPGGMSTCSDSQKLNAADLFLQYQIAPVLNSPQFQKDGLLVIWWDEGNAGDTANGGGRVAITLVGPSVKRAYKSSTFYQHQDLLRTIAEGLGIGFPGSSATAHSMAEFFSSSSSSGSGSVAGRVNDISTGAAVVASVTLGSTTKTTNLSGDYRFSSVAAGTYSVTAQASGYFSRTKSVTTTSGATSTLSFQLATGGIVAGTVKTSAGAAIANATVTLTGGAIATTKTITTGSTGYYNSNWVPVGTYSVVVSASGYTSQTKTISVTTGATSTLNFALGTSTQGSHSVALSWTAVSSAVGYNVYRSSQSVGPYTRMNPTLDTSTSFKDSSVVAGQTYYYVTTSVNASSVQSAYSAPAKAVIPTP